MYFTLSNQIQMPAIGIGTFLMTPKQAEEAVCTALTNGYRMIDTANAYMNERAVGRGIFLTIVRLLRSDPWFYQSRTYQSQCRYL